VRPTRLPLQGGDTVEALVTDQYLDALLTSGDRRAAARAAEERVAPDQESSDARAASAEPDTDLRHAGEVVRASLVRVHPSFRFEEDLAARLAELAAPGAARSVAMGGSRVHARSGDVIPFPGLTLAAAGDPLLDAVLDGLLDPADADAVARAAGVRSPARPLIVGGAITSAAISLVGVAWVAWRAYRPAGSTMSRAARAAHARRLADLAELAAGVHGGPA
jgi:hypothetical protein